MVRKHAFLNDARPVSQIRPFEDSHTTIRPDPPVGKLMLCR
jgi:hypothetical protein